jgi:exodeoxyribonuclease VIII
MIELNEQQIIDTVAKFQFDDNYYSDTKFISNSMLGYLKKSPKDLARFFEQGSIETPAMAFGRAFHLAILEPEVFSEKVAIFNGKTKRGKAWDEFVELNKGRGREIITSSEFQVIKNMEDALFSNTDIARKLHGNKEVPMVWQDKLTSVWCKGKVDILNGANGSGQIIDIKTTQDASLDAFRRNAYKYGYNRQASFYLDGFDAREFIFIVIEKKAPYNVGVFECSNEFIESGREEYMRLLLDYRKYFSDADPDNYELTNYYHKGIL